MQVGILFWSSSWLCNHVSYWHLGLIDWTVIGALDDKYSTKGGMHEGACPTSLLKANHQPHSWFDFFDAVLLVPGWAFLPKPDEIRLGINLRVPHKPCLPNQLQALVTD